MAAPITNVSTAAGHIRRVFSHRAQATLLSVALVLSSALPAGVAVAQEADQEREGVATPEPTAPPDSSADPDFDPGGDTALPFDLGAPAGGGEDDSGDGAPVDVEPVTDTDALAVPLNDPAAVVPPTPDGSDEPVPPAEPAPPTPPAEPAPTTPPAATTPETDVDQHAANERRHTARTKRGTARERRRDPVRQRPTISVTVPASAVPPAPVAGTPVATTTPEPVQTVAPTPGDRARAGQRIHTVQRGESLWTIANDLLGPNATNAEIAAESRRLYRANRDRIGDDPNLVIAGTVLRLR